MREEIYKSDCYVVHANGETFYIPEREAKDVTTVEDFQQFFGDVVFCEGASFVLVKGQFVARLSTKGEATEWSLHKSYKDAQDYLRNVDFEEEEYNDKFSQDRYIEEDD